MTGRTIRYVILRAIERIDPRAVYGVPWAALGYEEQLELIGFELLREFEEQT